MAGDAPESKPTREEAVSDLLRLGELLFQHAFPVGGLGLTRPLRPDESIALKTEIGELETRIEDKACVRSERRLRSMLNLRGDQVLDPLLLRCIACVAFQVMSGGRTRSTVTGISMAAGLGDWETTLSARHAIRHAIIKGNAIYYSDSDREDGILKAGRDLVMFLSGENALPVVWTERSLKEEKEEWERRKVGVAARRIPLARSAEHRLPADAPGSRAPLSDAQSPKAIFEALRKTVIGIDPVVRRFSVQMAMHLKRVAISRNGGTPTNPPVVVLLIGPSGAGKTFLAEEAGRLLKITFCCADMSSITASSYVGSSIDDAFLGYFRKGVTSSEIQSGLMLMDEIDKKRTNQRGGDFDSVGAGVQYELLRVLEGNRIQVGGKRGSDIAKGFIETFGMAFILAGAFSDISEKLRDSAKARTPLGFSGGHGASGVTPDTRELLLEYFIPELVNRIGSVIVIPAPSLGQLVQIATSPAGIISNQNQFWASFSLQIRPTPTAVNEIASWALETRTFARGMRSLLQSLAEEAIFEERQGEIVIGAGEVKKAIEGLRGEPEGLKTRT